MRAQIAFVSAIPSVQRTRSRWTGKRGLSPRGELGQLPSHSHSVAIYRETPTRVLTCTFLFHLFCQREKSDEASARARDWIFREFRRPKSTTFVSEKCLREASLISAILQPNNPREDRRRRRRRHRRRIGPTVVETAGRGGRRPAADVGGEGTRRRRLGTARRFWRRLSPSSRMPTFVGVLERLDRRESDGWRLRLTSTSSR